MQIVGTITVKKREVRNCQGIEERAVGRDCKDDFVNK